MKILKIVLAIALLFFVAILPFARWVSNFFSHESYIPGIITIGFSVLSFAALMYAVSKIEWFNK